MPPDGGIRESMDTIQAWVYSTCHIMVESTVWFGRRSPMTWMRPGNKSLFWGKISPKSHFIHLQTRLCGWDLHELHEMHRLHVWSPCATYNRGSERYVTCARNDFQCWNADRWLGFLSGRSSSEVVPDIRNGMKIFSPVSGWMMACVQRAWHRPHAFWSPEASVCGAAADLRERSLTCLIFWASHNCTPEVEDVQVILTVTYWYMSCHTLWYQHQYWPDDWRHREEAYHVCSHREVGCILSVVSVYKENYTISDSVQHFNVLFKYCYLKVFEQSTPITYFASSRMLPPIGDKLVL